MDNYNSEIESPKTKTLNIKYVNQTNKNKQFDTELLNVENKLFEI